MFFSVITKNSNWILTKNLVTFKRWVGDKERGLIPQCALWIFECQRSLKYQDISINPIEQTHLQSVYDSTLQWSMVSRWWRNPTVAMAGNHHPGLGGVKEIEGFRNQLNMFHQVLFTFINYLIQKWMFFGPCALFCKHALKARLWLGNI